MDTEHNFDDDVERVRAEFNGLLARKSELQAELEAIELEMAKLQGEFRVYSRFPVRPAAQHGSESDPANIINVKEKVEDAPIKK